VELEQLANHEVLVVSLQQVLA